MRRTIVVFFIVSFFTFSSNAFSGKHPKQDDMSSTSTTLTLRKAAAKITLGAASLFAWGTVDFGDPQERSYLNTGCSVLWRNASAGLITQGVCELCHLAYNWYYDKIMQPPLGRKGYGKKNTTFSPLTFSQGESYLDQREETWNRGTVKLHNVANASLTAFNLYRYSRQFLNFIEEGINPFSLSFPSSITCTAGKFLCAPLTTSVAMTLLSGLLVYQIKEILNGSRIAAKKQRDIPLMGMLSGLFEASLGHFLYQKYSDVDFVMVLTPEEHLVFFQKLQEDIQHNKLDAYMHPIPRVGYKLLLLHGNSQIFWNGLQTFYNAIKYVKNTFEKPHRIEIKPIKHKVTQTSTPQLLATSQEGGKQEEKTSGSELDFSVGSQKRRTAIEPKKAKTKTRGTPSHNMENLPSKGKKQHDSEQSLSQPIDTAREKEREEALTRIQELRKEYPIKVATINEEMQKVCKFLKGTLEAAGHRTKKLSWDLGSNHVSISYEEPHRPSTEYKGNKRDRVLSVLEIGYISGLDLGEIEKYTQKYNLQSLLRLDKFFIYTLGHRGHFD